MKHKKKQHKTKKATLPVEKVMKGTISVPVQDTTLKVEKDYKYALPITEIKKDLIKTAVYAVFALGVILALNYFMPETGLKFNLSSYKFF